MRCNLPFCARTFAPLRAESPGKIKILIARPGSTLALGTTSKPTVLRAQNTYIACKGRERYRCASFGTGNRNSEPGAGVAAQGREQLEMGNWNLEIEHPGLRDGFRPEADGQPVSRSSGNSELRAIKKSRFCARESANIMAGKHLRQYTPVRIGKEL